MVSITRCICTVNRVCLKTKRSMIHHSMPHVLYQKKLATFKEAKRCQLPCFMEWEIHALCIVDFRKWLKKALKAILSVLKLVSPPLVALSIISRQLLRNHANKLQQINILLANSTWLDFPKEAFLLDILLKNAICQVKSRTWSPLEPHIWAWIQWFIVLMAGSVILLTKSQRM